MLGMMGYGSGSNYDDDTKFGQTFRSLMKSVKEALESAHPGTKQLKNIRRFLVPVKGGNAFIVEVMPNGPHYRVSQNSKRLHTDMFDDLLRPVLEAIGNAKLSDSSPKYPDSVLKQATEEEHAFSHMLNTP